MTADHLFKILYKILFMHKEVFLLMEMDEYLLPSGVYEILLEYDTSV